MLGTFEEYPSVVYRTSDGTKECDYSWTMSGKMDAESDSAFFTGGVLSAEGRLTEMR